MKKIITPGLIVMLAIAGYHAQAAAPPNDDFANAIDLPGDTGFLAGNNNIDATFQAGEPECLYPVTTNTVWFKWTCTAAGAFTINTAGSVNLGGGDWDAVVCIYTGSTLGTLVPAVKQDTGLAETVTIMASPGTYYLQLGGWADASNPPDVATDIQLTWSFALPVVVDISNDTTPWEPANPAAGVDINSTVGSGNIGRLVGLTQTHWASQGFTSIGIQLNDNSMIVDSGGGNVPFRAYGPISGNGSVTFDTPLSESTKINVQGDNTYTGTTLVRRGWISLENPDGQDALAGDITVGGTESGQAGALVWTYAGNQINDAANVTVTANGSYLDLNGHGETFNTLTLPSGTQVRTGLGTGNNLEVANLVMGDTAYTTGAFGADTPGGYVTGSGYILVGGTLPPVVTDPPTAPSTPSPADTATGVSPLSQTLSWADSVRATSYDIYFWLSTDTKPASATATGLTVAHYAAPSPLLDYGTYKWQVVARNTVGPTAGPEWAFTTTSRTNISNLLGPLHDGGLDIDAVVGVGNTGLLVGTTETYWASAGFTVDLNLNGNTLNLAFGGNPGKICSGRIFGDGAVIFQASGAAPGIRVTGTSGNTYTGTTTVSAYVQLEKTAGDALCGSVTLNDAAATLVWFYDNQINDAADVSLTTSGASLNLADFSDTIKSLTLETDTFVDTGLGAGGVLTVTNLTVNGVTQLPGTYTSVESTWVQGSGSVVVFPAALAANAGVDKALSPGTPSAVLGATPAVTGGTGPYTYSWSPGTGLSSPTDANPTVTTTAATTTYTLIVTDSLLATATDSVVVTYTVPALVVSAGPARSVSPGSPSVAIGGSPTASGGSGLYTYSWSPSTGLSSATVANPTASPTATTTYTVTVTDSLSTTATASVVVTYSAVATGYSAYISGTTPVGWWGMNEPGAATTTADLSGAYGSANNQAGADLPLTYQSPGVNSLPDQAGFVSGAGNRAAYLDGSSNSGAYGHGASAYDLNVTGAIYRYEPNGFAIETWVKADGVLATDCERVVSTREFGLGIQIAAGAFGNLQFTTFGKQDYFSTAAMPSDGLWHQIGVSFDGNVTASFYIDGLPAGTSVGTASGLRAALSPGGNTINLTHRNTDSQHFKGWVDELVIWGSPRSDADFAASYAAGVPAAGPTLTITRITGPAGGNFTITGTSSASATVVLLKSTNLATPLGSWTTPASVSYSSMPATTFTITVPEVGGENAAFYRLKTNP